MLPLQNAAAKIISSVVLIALHSLLILLLAVKFFDDRCSEQECWVLAFAIITVFYYNYYYNLLGFFSI